MGHASLETTRLYTCPSAADMQRAVDLLTTMEQVIAVEALAELAAGMRGGPGRRGWRSRLRLAETRASRSR